MFKSKITWFVIAFAAGGILTYFFLPEKTIIKEKERVRVEKVEVEKEVIVEKEVVKEVVKTDRRIVRKTTKPDGTVVEEEIYETIDEQLDRVHEEAALRVAKAYEELEKEKSRTKIIINPKKLNVYAGANPLDPYHDFIGGFNYGFWGPTTVGVAATTAPFGAYVTFGLRF